MEILSRRRIGSSRGVNSDQSSASLKHFWLKQLNSIFLYMRWIAKFKNRANVSRVYWTFGFHICCSRNIVQSGGMQKYRKKYIRQYRDTINWTLNIYFWYLQLSQNSPIKRTKRFRKLKTEWFFTILICREMKKAQLFRSWFIMWINCLTSFIHQESNFNVIRIQNEERVHRSVILESKLGKTKMAN